MIKQIMDISDEIVEILQGHAIDIIGKIRLSLCYDREELLGLMINLSDKHSDKQINQLIMESDIEQIKINRNKAYIEILKLLLKDKYY